jgi:hypothetical protein
MVRLRAPLLTVAIGFLALALALSLGSTSQMAFGAGASADDARAAANSPQEELGGAVASFAAVDPSLFTSDEPARTGRLWIKPSLRPVAYAAEEGTFRLSTRLSGASSRLEVNLSNERNALEIGNANYEFGFPSQLAERSSELRSTAGMAGAAFVVAGVQRDTDALVRALPFGVSVYLLFRSAQASERVFIESVLECPYVGFQLARELDPGTFSYEEQLTNEDQEDECEEFSHTPVADLHAPPPTDSGRAFQAERRLLGLAEGRARRDRATAELVLRAYPARDAAGHPVLTEMSWREDDEEGGGPQLRVHLDNEHLRYPVLVRLDVIAP